MRRLFYIIAFVSITYFFSHAQTPDSPDSSYIQTSDNTDTVYISLDDCEIAIPAPVGWAFDLENASLDNYTAAIIPNSQDYFDHNMIIHLWVFGLDSISFAEFVSADSLKYLQKNDSLEFRSGYSFTDSMLENSLPNIVLETADPGGICDLALVAYIELGGNLAIFQLDISDRIYFRDASSALGEIVINTDCIPKN